jgi:tetratricopeptide (TPR) repeat protein/predicted Ser/Thr protein kinase
MVDAIVVVQHSRVRDTILRLDTFVTPSTSPALVSAGAETVAAGFVPPAALLARGALVGRYVILDAVGTGGMGRVYAAYDPDLGRKVALKLLHDDTAEPQRQSRLLREAQAMARLSHPNICPVYDVGSFDGRVFFAMEFIHGVTLRTWLEKRALEWRDVLELFLAIGRGIAAAHAEGLVHSDLKPENIMIDASGRPRVMDFGIARMDGGPRTDESTLLTGRTPDTDGSASVTAGGTPQYMAPEQWRGAAIDARADQFAFCVAFWEALFGRRPFPDGYVAAQVMEGGDLVLLAPAQPSRAPAWLRALLARGLSARPEQRFTDMPALLAALASGQRRRRRSFLAVGAAALALVIGGLAGAYALDQRRFTTACAAEGDAIVADVWTDAVRARLTAGLAGSGMPDAAELASRVAAWNDAFAGRWREVRSAACLARDERPLRCLSDQRQRFTSLLDAFAEDDPRARSGAIRLAASLPDPRQCADPVLTAAAAAADGEDAHELATEFRQALRQSEVAVAVGHVREARSRALEIRDAAADAGLPGVHAEATVVAGMLADADTDYAEAERLLRRAVVEAGALRRDDIAADAAIRLVLILAARMARHEEALMVGDFAEMLVQRLGQADRYRGARLLGYQAVALTMLGRLSEARALSERSLESLRRNLGALHPELTLSMSFHASILKEQGDYKASLALHTEALAMADALFGAGSIEAATCMTNMGLMHSYLGEQEEAIALQRRALEIFARVRGVDAPDTARVRLNLGNALNALGRHPEAKAEYEAAYRAIETALGPDHPDTGRVLNDLAGAEEALGEHAQAEQHFRRALAILEAVYGPDHPQLLHVLNPLGDLLRLRGRVDEAVSTLERSVRLGTEQSAPREMVADARLSLAHIAWETRRDRTTALALAEQAAVVYREVRGQRVQALAELEDWIQELNQI